MAFDPNVARVLLANIGSFWSEVFADYSKLGTIVSAGVDEMEQSLLGALDAVASVSRFEIPVFKRHVWNKLTTLEDDILRASANVAEFGDNYTFGVQLNFDTPVGEPEVWRIPIATDVVSIKQLVDRPINPTVTWTEGVEFKVNRDDGVIECALNPLRVFPMGELNVDGVDKQALTMWAYGLDQDIKLVQNHFGFVVGAYIAKSSENLKSVVNAIFDTLQTGSNTLSFRYCLAGIAGIPVVQNEEETIESIVDAYDELTVVTDKSVYSFDPRATAIYDVGDQVFRGDILVDTLRFLDGEQLNDLGDITGIAVEPGNIRAELNGPIVFANKEVSVNIDEVDGQQIATFEVGGYAEDVEAFWAYVQAQTLGSPFSVAKALRTDGVSSGEPTAVSNVVNPALFLVGNVLKSNLIIVRIKLEQATLLGDIKTLLFSRKLAPAHVGVIFFMDLDMGVEELGAIDDGGSLNIDTNLLVGLAPDENLDDNGEMEEVLVEAFHV